MNQFLCASLARSIPVYHQYDDSVNHIGLRSLDAESPMCDIVVTSAYRLDDRITRANVFRAKRVALFR